MRFALLGGDRRSAILGELLLNEGHRVISYGLEGARLPETLTKAGCLQGAVYGADAVLLPVPAERAGLLNAPLGAEPLAMEELMASLWQGQIVCGGRLSEKSREAAVRAGLHASDLMERPEFVMGNAALTAEGALEKLMGSSEKSLWRSRVLITGWGRIGKLLALRLRALGAFLTVCARAGEDRAMAETLGFEALSFGELEGRIGDFDFIVNTVPSRLITKAMLCCCRADTVILELASPPGGFDRNLAENIGLKVISAPGLPGSCAPYTGALLMKEAVYGAINEQEE